MALIKLPCIVGASIPNASSLGCWREFWACCDCCRFNGFLVEDNPPNLSPFSQHPIVCPRLVGALGQFARAWCYNPQDGDWANNRFPANVPNPPLGNCSQGYVTPLTLVSPPLNYEPSLFPSVQNAGDSSWFQSGILDLGIPAAAYNGGGQLWYNFCRTNPKPPPSLISCASPLGASYPCDTWIFSLYSGGSPPYNTANGTFAQGCSFDYISPSLNGCGPNTFSFYGINGVPGAAPAGVPATVTLTPISSNGAVTDCCQNTYCPGTKVALHKQATFSGVKFTGPSSPCNGLPFNPACINGKVLAIDYCPSGALSDCLQGRDSTRISGVWSGNPLVDDPCNPQCGFGPNTSFNLVTWYDLTNGNAYAFLQTRDLQGNQQCIGNRDGNGFLIPMQASGCSQLVFTWSMNIQSQFSPWLSSSGTVTIA